MPRGEPNWTELVSLAVHEMRSPLNVVSGFLGLLLGGHGGPLTPVQRRAVEAAEASAVKVTDLLESLSELARLEGGRLRPSQDRVAVADLLAAAAARFVPPLDQPVQCLVAGDVPDAHVVVDHQRMAGAVAAMAACVSRGAPTSPVVALRAMFLGDRVALTASSGGAAPAPADLDHLGPLPVSQGGLGLALPLARVVVAHAGGSAGVPRGGEAAGQLAVLLPRR